MKRVLSLVLCLLMVMSILAACGEPQPTEPAATEHKHSYSKTWAFDDTSHWYPADCGHELQANLADHEDANKDGACDVCTWVSSCDHGFDMGVWASDETSHWHPATCVQHSGAKSELANHTDENNDGACDVCGFSGGHNHSYATQWSADEKQHW